MKNHLKIAMLLAAIVSGLITFFYSESKKFEWYLLESIPEDGFNISINSKAPVISKANITIQSSQDMVWHLLTQINLWPSWQPEVTTVEIQGETKLGARFSWKSGGLEFKSYIHTMKPNSFFGWTGEILGVQAVHNWQIEDHGSFVIVYVEESLQGALPKLFRSSFQKNLDNGMEKSLKELKQAAENAQKE